MRPSDPRPSKRGKGLRAGGCSIRLSTGETVRVLTDADITALKLRKGTLTKFEINDFTIYSGDEVWINPAYVVKIT